MINILKQIFGTSGPADISELMSKGAQILDVRTKEEYQRGHVAGSLNIPLNNLESQLNKLNKNKPVITICASGMRSESAKNMLKSHGFAEVHNAGGWMNLEEKLRKN